MTSNDETSSASDLSAEEQKPPIIPFRLAASLPKVRPYHGEGSQRFQVEDWLVIFNAAAEGLDDLAKLNMLKQFLKGAARDWYTVMCAHDQTLTYQKVTQDMIEHFNMEKDEYSKNDELENFKQREDQYVADYIMAKLSLCLRLKPDMTEDDKQYYVMQGMKPSMRKAVRQNKPETIKDMLRICRQYEKAEKCTMDLPCIEQTEPISEIDFLRREIMQLKLALANSTRPTRKLQRQIEPKPITNASNRSVYQADRYDRRSESQQSRASIRTRSRYASGENRGSLNYLVPRDNRRAAQRSVNMLVPAKMKYNDRPLVTVVAEINQISVEAVVDTGSMVTCISELTAQQAKCKIEPCSEEIYLTASGEELSPTGKIKVPMRIWTRGEAKTFLVEAVVFKTLNHELLLGKEFTQQAKMVIDCESSIVTFKQNSPIHPEAQRNRNADRMNQTQNEVEVSPEEKFKLTSTRDYVIPPKTVVKINVGATGILPLDYKKYKLSNSLASNKSSYIQFRDGLAELAVENKLQDHFKIAKDEIVGEIQIDDITPETILGRDFWALVTVSTSVIQPTEETKIQLALEPMPNNFHGKYLVAMNCLKNVKAPQQLIDIFDEQPTVLRLTNKAGSPIQIHKGTRIALVTKIKSETDPHDSRISARKLTSESIKSVSAAAVNRASRDPRRADYHKWPDRLAPNYRNTTKKLKHDAFTSLNSQ
ncbi:hypothetical protein HDE_02259 [Halotydeus destructor]|nr:hypothetical protein HDE_02259 [Halotydeus destructor]